MKAVILPKHRAACLQLLDHGSLPYSACGRSLIAGLKPLFDSKVIRREKAAGGQRLVVVSPSGFQRWFQQHFPSASPKRTITSSRVLAVAQFRDTKALRSNLPEIVCVRSVNDGNLFRDGLPVETTRSTEEHGVFALALKDHTPFTLRGACLLIENPAVFHSFEILGLEVALAIYGRGRCSNRFLKWLESNARNGLKVLHLPDYDPLGLTEFLRLHKRLGESITLYTPNALPSLFRRHSKGALLHKEKNQRMLIELRKSNHPSVRDVVSMIDSSNAGLEQEAMLTEDQISQA